VLIVISAAFFAYTYYYIVSPVGLAQSRTITIVPGDSFAHIATQLKKENIIKHDWLFIAFGLSQSATKKVQAGEYQIDPNNSPQDILEKFMLGKVKLYKLALIEGWTLKQVLQAVSKDAALSHQKGEIDLKKIGPCRAFFEGYFYPDTYSFPKGTADLKFLSRAHKKMKVILEAIWRSRDETLSLKTPYELLTLASIIEKETNQTDEYGKISSVFNNRLNKGIPLQADPTVIFGLGDQCVGQLTTKALYSAAHPDKTKLLYFVADGKGGHQFSETLKAHQVNVAKYRRQHAELTKQKTKSKQ